MNNYQKIQLRIKSVDKTTFSLYLVLIKKTLKILNIKNSIFCLPNRKKRLSLLKSPHVNKKAIEQFELKIFASIITLQHFKFSNELLKSLIINKPKNIDLKIKRMV